MDAGLVNLLLSLSVYRMLSMWLEISILDGQDFVEAIKNETQKHPNHMHKFQCFPKEIYFPSAHPDMRYNTHVKPIYTRVSRFSFEAVVLVFSFYAEPRIFAINQACFFK